MTQFWFVLPLSTSVVLLINFINNSPEVETLKKEAFLFVFQQYSKVLHTKTKQNN